MRWLFLVLPALLYAELPPFESLPQDTVGNYRYSVLFRVARSVYNTQQRNWTHTLEIYARRPKPQAPIPTQRLMYLHSQKAEIFPAYGGLQYGECFMIDSETFSDCSFPDDYQGEAGIYLPDAP